MDPLSIGIMAGGQILGGLLGSDSAKKAARQQAAAQREAAQMQLQGVREGNALQAAMYRNNMGLMSPTIGAGQTALSALMSGMGLGSLQTGRVAPGPSGDVGTPVTGGSTGFLSRDGSPYTGPVMTDASGRPVDQAGNPLTSGPDLGEVPGITQEQADAAATPFAGTFLERFTGQDIYRDPSYEFRLSEGERLLRARQAAGGNRWGSQAMKDIMNYGQEAASQEYGNAYNRFVQQKEQLYNRLAGIAQGGQQTAGAAGSIGQQTAGSMAGAITQGYGGAAGNLGNVGTALAGGTVGSTNALVGGINNAANTWMANQYFNAMRGAGTGVPGTTGGPGLTVPGGFDLLGGRP